MEVVIDSPPKGLSQENRPLLYVSLQLGRRTVQNMIIHPCCDEGHRIGSVHAVIWQAGTNWAGPASPESPDSCSNLNTVVYRIIY